jgi:glycosyltransferase involved in cell wall biosynthesis
MKIVINTIPLLSPLTGVGNYIYSLVNEFRKQRPDYDYTYYYGYFTNKLTCYSSESDDFYRAKEFVKTVPLISSVARGLRNKLARLHPEKYDLYFEPNFIPMDIRAGGVVTTVLDFSFLHHPQWHPKDRIRHFSKNFFKRIYRSDIIITTSKYVEGEARDILKVEDSRVVSIPLGYNPVFNSVEGGKVMPETSEKYILFTGSIEPRKNLVRLLRAYLMLPGQIKKEYRLLLAGFKGWENKEIVELMGKLGEKARYMGYVDNETLASLYRKAACFVYPSLYEGFGLPPIEAMASGCPVVVSRVASLPEVCGDAACYVDPVDTESIAEGIINVLENRALRKDLITRGLERARLFSWERTAAETMRVFEEAAGAHR